MIDQREYLLIFFRKNIFLAASCEKAATWTLSEGTFATEIGSRAILAMGAHEDPSALV
jgi:hypothetical protein